MQETNTIKVKPLVWDEHNRADIYSVKDTYGQGPKPLMLVRNSRVIGWFDEVDEAKAEAQSDHEKRTLAAIDLE